MQAGSGYTIIIGRIKIKIDEEISVMQAGFLEGRGTRDQDYQ